MGFLDTVGHDLRLVLRTFGRQRAWTAVAVATIALGIGANSALFTIINAVLLRPLPYPDAGRILPLSERYEGVDREVVKSTTFAGWRRSRSLAATAAYGGTSAIVNRGDEPEVVNGLRTTANYFAVMRRNPELGRVFTLDEDRPGAPRVVVLSR